MGRYCFNCRNVTVDQTFCTLHGWQVENGDGCRDHQEAFSMTDDIRQTIESAEKEGIL